jgi:hypothetical protein
VTSKRHAILTISATLAPNREIGPIINEDCSITADRLNVYECHTYSDDRDAGGRMIGCLWLNTHKSSDLEVVGKEASSLSLSVSASRLIFLLKHRIGESLASPSIAGNREATKDNDI